MSITVELHDKETLLSAIQDVRKDDTDTNWCLIGHKDGNPNTLVLEGTGADGFAGLKANIKNDKVAYALLRVTTKVDLSVTVKFVYVHWIGEEVPFAKRGKFNIVHGSAVKFFQPYHVDFDITNLSEISEALIKEKVEMAAGNANYVRSADFAIGKPEFGKNQNQKTASNQALNNKGPGSQPNLANADSTGNLKKAGTSASQGSLNNLKTAAANVATQATGTSLDADFAAALKEMRSDKSSVKWISGTFKEGNIKSPIVFHSSGETASVDSLKATFSPSQFLFYLLKVIDVIDGHPTVKFVFITQIGADISMVSKAKVATYKGILGELFSPFHVDFVVETAREISDSIVMDKVQLASGSKSKTR